MEKSDEEIAALVARKYKEAGWQIIPSKGAINDLIVSNGGKIHFVQIRVKGSSDARYIGAAMNDFVQNAFSNGAIPIHAHVTLHPKAESTVALYNPEQNKRVLLTAPKVADTIPAPKAEVKEAPSAKVAKAAKVSAKAKAEPAAAPAPVQAPPKPVRPAKKK